ncbi:hypothetical protein FIM12_02300 [SAR202 cluster bacterium AD-804-J14_MRT_500m]|nr:hypothetical protein [SAR202 cluster bacterium AD-804-J14_MRT_500m]
MIQRIDKYDILEEMGSGGQAIVYKARDRSLGRTVALKVLHPHLTRDPQFRQRFLRDARLAASLNHPNVVTVHEVGESDNTLYIAMELVPNSLDEELKQHGKLELSRAINIGQQTAQALQAAHDRGIVHRDIKPQNILLTEDGTAKVADFGIATASFLSSMTNTGTYLGTPDYMSPEQCKGEQADSRSDIYSLGIVIYQMLTGNLPFPADSPLAVMRKHIEDPPPPLDQMDSRIPRTIQDIVAICLEKQPDRRYRSATALANSLNQVSTESSPGPRTSVFTPPSPSVPRPTPVPVPLPIPSPPIVSDRKPPSEPPEVSVHSADEQPGKRFSYKALFLISGLVIVPLAILSVLGIISMAGGSDTQQVQPEIATSISVPATHTPTPAMFTSISPPTPTATPIPTPIPIPQATATQSLSDTPTLIPQATATQSPSDTPTPIPQATATQSPSDTPTPVPQATATQAPSDTPTPIPHATATQTPSEGISGPQWEAASISVGSNHTCAITTTGGGKCWGSHASGQLGNGGVPDRWTPWDVSGLKYYVADISAGGSHTCAVTTTGGIKCWGSNAQGQLGDGSPWYARENSTGGRVINVENDGRSAIAVGTYHSCALTINGSVQCWGYNASGQLGNGTSNDRTSPSYVQGFSYGVKDISAGGNHTCVVTESNGVKCWGHGGNFQLGQLEPDSTNSYYVPVDVVGLDKGVSSISAGADHTCALTTEGGIKCWGSNGNGRLGYGGVTDYAIPIDVSGLESGVSVVSAGSRHTCAVTTAGGIKCWGSNSHGQLGDGTTIDRATPVDVSGLTSGVSTVSAGKNHTCAVTTSGRIKCWGSNTYGQLGNGSTSNTIAPVDVNMSMTPPPSPTPTPAPTPTPTPPRTPTPTPTPGPPPLPEVSFLLTGSSGDESIGTVMLNVSINTASTDTILVDYNVTSGSASGAGQDYIVGGSSLGFAPGGTSKSISLLIVDDSISESTETVIVSLYNPINAVLGSSSSYTFYILDNDTGSSSSSSVPQATATPTPTPQATATTTPSPTPTTAPTPTPVPSWSATLVRAGDAHTCAITSPEGYLKCWGHNQHGQLGDGSNSNRHTPVDTLGLNSGVSDIATGSRHTCVITYVGGVQCWGHNNTGQLGDGTTNNRSTKVDVLGLTSGVSAISAGIEHTCALTTAGGIKCWGSNQSGQMGNGTTSLNQTSPGDVTGHTTGMAGVAAGQYYTCAITTSGITTCWGSNNYGQMGNGTTLGNQTSPGNVVGIDSIFGNSPITATYIAAGDKHACVITSNQGVKCWGGNTAGQLGDGSTTDRTTAVQVSGLTSGVSQISLGNANSCALTSAGGLKCWGSGQQGRVGDGYTHDRPYPVDVYGLSNGVIDIGVGNFHACAVTTGGGVKCWGSGHSGALGVGGDPPYKKHPTNVYGTP